MITRARTIAVPRSVTAGVACDASDMDRKCVYVSGSFTATVQIQLSADGTNWFDEGTALTAAGSLEITKPARYIRANTTAYTSGTPLATVVGIYSTEAGGRSALS
jgi:hypothetical protein